MSKFENRLAWPTPLATAALQDEQREFVLGGQSAPVRLLTQRMVNNLVPLVEGSESQHLVQAMICTTAIILMRGVSADTAWFVLRHCSGVLVDMAGRMPGRWRRPS